MANKDLKGAIIINAFNKTESQNHQAKRMQDEFTLLGYDVPIIKREPDGAFLSENNVRSIYSDLDFAVYFDKDKYFSKVLFCFFIFWLCTVSGRAWTLKISPLLPSFAHSISIGRYSPASFV